MGKPRTRARADEELLARGLAASIEEARARILAGEVWSGAARIETAGAMVASGASLEIRPRGRRFASRAGEKLHGALERLGLDVAGRRCLDVGASTGGFTDVLLRRGAAEVTALDVGRGQLDAKLRADPRVRIEEGRNVRHVRPEEIGGPFDVVVVDVAFASLAGLMPALAPLLARPAGDMLLLVKPQFEARREDVGTGGVVRDPRIQEFAVESVARAASSAGLEVRGRMPSPLKGARGNQEHFLRLGWRA